jgi:hypothetical protein
MKNVSILILNRQIGDQMTYSLMTKNGTGRSLCPRLHAVLRGAILEYMSAHLQQGPLSALMQYEPDEKTEGMGHVVVTVTSSSGAVISTLKFTVWKSEDSNFSLARACDN